MPRMNLNCVGGDRAVVSSWFMMSWSWYRLDIVRQTRFQRVRTSVSWAGEVLPAAGWNRDFPLAIRRSARWARAAIRIDFVSVPPSHVREHRSPNPEAEASPLLAWLGCPLCVACREKRIDREGGSMRRDDGPMTIQDMREAQRGVGPNENSWPGTPGGGGSPSVCGNTSTRCVRIFELFQKPAGQNCHSIFVRAEMAATPAVSSIPSGATYELLPASRGQDSLRELLASIIRPSTDGSKRGSRAAGTLFD